MPWTRAFLAVALVSSACAGAPRTASPSAGANAEVAGEVRAFLAVVAREVTANGPSAWHNLLLANPAFFMAVNGQLVFADDVAADRGIEAVTHTIKHIELRWGEPMRVDALSSTLAMVAMPYHEIQVSPDGRQVEDSGYFTALVERGPRGWRFRNAHWSSTAPSAPSPPPQR
jgi:hypothetical protein